MLFTDGVFTPQSIQNHLVRSALCLIASHGPERVGSAELLSSVLRQDEAAVMATLAQSIRPGFSLEDLRCALLSTGLTELQPPAVLLTRASFTPQALTSLDEFEAALHNSEGLLSGAELILLLHCILSNLDAQDRQLSAVLDTDQASALLREQLVRGMAFGPLMDKLRDLFCQSVNGAAVDSRVDEEPFVLPADLLPSEDLTYRARTAVQPDQPPFTGQSNYEEMFRAVTRAFHSRQARHIFLVGERGVGKTTLLAEVARRAAARAIPSLAECRFLLVDCRYLAPDEARFRLAGVLAHVAQRADLVVCLDGFASFLRSGGGACKAGLLPTLAKIRCRLVALVTPREYEEFVADDCDFGDYFRRVDVSEPDAATALKILRHFARGLENQFQVVIEDEAIRQAVALSANYILNDQLPAKALRLLHRSCEDIDFARSEGAAPSGRVTADDMVRAVAEVSGVPEETLRGIAERSDYEQSLGELIVGQGDAVRAVATELGLIKAGMTDPTKPATVLLFLGQTGTGKTEMAKVLARFYSTSKRLKTYTLGNCVEPHSVSTIIGVPPGYVGNDQGGRLVNELNADPYSVFLLDEVDKAHPDVLQPFLNLFDEGWLIDQRGARAYANKSIFILTSNVGQRMIAEMKQQGKSMEEIAERMKEALSQIRHSKSNRPVFAPEFLARIKRVIVFNPLDQAAMHGISRKLITELAQSWAAKRGKVLKVPDALVDYIADQSFQTNEKSQGKEGGRIVRKLIADWIEARTQRAITEHPSEYRSCRTIEIGFLPAESGTSSAAVTVRFSGGTALIPNNNGSLIGMHG